MATRDDIITELKAGETPYRLSKRYPRASVYRLYNELVQSGQLGDVEIVSFEDLGGGASESPHKPASPQVQARTQTITVEKEEPSVKTGAEVIDFTGPKGLPISAVNRIRGILGMTLRPKVLTCPAPELLYPAMVISVSEFGFPPMRPDDFIDTVLYQWLDACGIVPYAFIKKSELEEMAKTYSETEEIIKDEKFRREHGLVTTDEIKEAVLNPLPDKETKMTEEVEELLDEPDVEEPESIVDMLKESTEEINIGGEVKSGDGGEPEPSIEPQPHKLTVGELLQGLRIENIQKEVEESGSTGRAESISP